LEESLKLWERGEELAKICQEWLDGAKKKLDAIKPTSD
jgi:exodeoxyribonuclease VII small subunit